MSRDNSAAALTVRAGDRGIRGMCGVARAIPLAFEAAGRHHDRVSQDIETVVLWRPTGP